MKYPFCRGPTTYHSYKLAVETNVNSRVLEDLYALGPHNSLPMLVSIRQSLAYESRA
jgi:hypothetical protein